MVCELPLFSGEETESVEDWLFQFDNAFAINNLKEDDKIRHACSVLRNQAFKWYKEQCMKSGETWTHLNWIEFVRRIAEEFGKENSTEELWRYALSLKQQQNECINRYYQRAKIYFKAPGLDSKISIKLFIHGLQNQYVKDVAISQPKSLEDAYNIAKAVESANLIGKDNVKEEVITKGQKSQINVDELSKLMGEMNLFLAKGQREKPVKICSYCKKRGHTDDDCWKKNSKNTNENKINDYKSWKEQKEMKFLELEESDILMAEKRTSSMLENNTARGLLQKDEQSSKKRTIAKAPSKLSIHKEKGIKSSKTPMANEIPLMKGEKVFSITEELKKSTANLTLAQLLHCSPGLRKELRQSLSQRKTASELAKLDGPDGRAPRVDGSINGYHTEIIIDGGAGMNIISKTFLDRLGLPIEEPASISIKLGDGSRIEPLGKISDLILQVSDLQMPIDAVVLQTDFPMLLGKPWLQKVKAVTSWTDGQFFLFWKGKRTSIHAKSHTMLLEDKLMKYNQISQFELSESSEWSSNKETDEEEESSVVTTVSVDTELSESNDNNYGKMPKDPNLNGSIWKGEPLELSLLEDEEDDEKLLCSITITDDVSHDLITKIPPQLNSSIKPYLNMFSSDLQKLPLNSVVEHSIDTGDAAPIKQRARRLNPSEKSFIQKELARLLDAGIIRPADSPWSSPIVLARKKSGDYRLCIDYRKLNSLTRKDVWTLPRTDDLLDSVSGAIIFSTLDAFSGYWQIKVRPNDIEKTAFTTPFGNYSFLVMPFGLTNAPATYQKLMDNLFRDIIGSYVAIYLDDILIYSSTLEKHKAHINEVLKRLSCIGFLLNPSKCFFGKESVTFLGHILSKHGISVDPEKTKAITLLKSPNSITGVRSFCGLCSYYRRFIPFFSKVASPLFELLKKDKPFIWGTVQQKAFNILRESLTKAPTLLCPNFDKGFIVQTDASGVAVGGVLSQLDDSGYERPVAYASRSITKAESNYTSTELECLGVIFCLKKFRIYLLGNQFLLKTDHSALRELINKKDPAGRLARWICQLQEYDFQVVHIKGSSNVIADCLSRYSIPESLLTECMSIDYLHLIFNYLKNLSIPESLSKTERLKVIRRSKGFYISEGIFMKKSKGIPIKVILANDERISLMTYFHEGSGHFGAKTVWDSLKGLAWWPNMRANIISHIKSCDICQYFGERKPSGLIIPIRTSSIFQRFGMDFLGPLPTSRLGNSYILVATEYLTKWPIAKAVVAADAVTVAKFIYEEIIICFGCPEIILTDQGLHFRNNFIAELMSLLKVKHKFSSPYHPQTNGLTERFNRTLCTSLKKMCLDKKTDWDLCLDCVLFSYRVRKHSTNGKTPFEMMYGVRPILPIHLQKHCEIYQDDDCTLVDNDDDNTQRNNEIQKLHKAREIVNVRINKRKSEERAQNFGIDDLVLVHRTADSRGLGMKFQPTWAGPFIIHQKLTPTTYSVKTEKGKILPRPVNQDRLKRYIPKRTLREYEMGLASPGVKD